MVSTKNELEIRAGKAAYRKFISFELQRQRKFAELSDADIANINAQIAEAKARGDSEVEMARLRAEQISRVQVKRAVDHIIAALQKLLPEE